MDGLTRVRGGARVMLTGLLLAVAGWPGIVRGDSPLYEEALRSTAWVLTKTDGKTSTGTGVLIDAERRLVVSNFHVVGEARAAVIFFPDRDAAGKLAVDRQHYIDNVKTLGVRGKIVAIDRKRDLALIEIDRIPEHVKAMELAPQPIGPGEAAHSIGCPGASDALWTYTAGSVRAVYRKQFRTGVGEHDFTVVVTQSPINSGDSGGPVFNDAGQLVAVSQSIAPNARLVSYCVDLSEVKSFLASDWKPVGVPLSELLRKAELEFIEHDKGPHEVQFEQDDKQKQSVFVERQVEYYEQADVRRVWSLAATLKQPPAEPALLKLLEQNAQTPIGSWTLERNPQGEYLVIYCARLDATATPDAAYSTLRYVAKAAAAGRKELVAQSPVQTASAVLDDWLGKGK